MKKHSLLWTMLFIIIIFTTLDILKEDKKFSPQENRILTSKPTLNGKNFFDGSFTKKYEKYVNDQFIFRDKWVNLKSVSEFTLGKKENNNIVYGKDGYMFEKIQKIDEERLYKNIDAIKEFMLYSTSANIKPIFMIIPSSYSILEDKLPYDLHMVNEIKFIDEIYDQLNNDNIVNINEIFKKNKNDYIYYKTDHHWTNYGAKLAYYALMNHLNENFENFKTNEIGTIENFLGSYYSKSKDFKVQKDYINYYKLDGLSMELDNGELYNSIYDYSKENSVDKYSFFLYGNNGLSIIKNNNLKNNKKVIVIKDSFSNSLIPFLSQNYEEIHVIDLRYTSLKLSEYIKNNNYENIFIIYNFLNLCNDVNVLKMKY